MVAPTSFFSDYGGHIRILEETRALQTLGHEVAIVTYYKGDDLPGLDIRRTAPLPWRADYEVGSSRHKLAFDVYLAATTLRQGLRFRPDVIHGHMHEGALIGGVLAKLLRVPLVFDFQGSLTGEMLDHGFLNPDGLVYPAAFRLERFITRRLPQAILTSTRQAAQLLEGKFDVPPARIHPLPDCADTTRFDPDRFSEEVKRELRGRLGIPDGRPIVAYLGLLTDYQGVHHLVQAAADLKRGNHDAHFLVMGYPSVAHYQAMAQELDVAERMTFTGKVEYRDAPYYLSLGDIAVAPKMSATEGSGKLLNYMAMGQPVVAYETPVSREFLGEHGVYAPVGDSGALAEKIRELISSPAMCQELGAGLRRRAENEFNWGKAAAKISAIYTHLTK